LFWQTLYVIEIQSGMMKVAIELLGSFVGDMRCSLIAEDIAARKELVENKLAIILIGLAVATSALAQVTRYIDPMLGVDGGGNTFPGPSLPFGMIKPGPDMGDNKGNAGWKSDGNINGFSQTHVNGAGGGPKYGNILIQPTTGIPRAGNYASPRADEQASVGYYRVTLGRYRTNVEITTASRAAIYRFTYPSAEAKNILFDVSHMLSGTNDYGEAQTVISSSIHVLSPTEVAGHSTLVGGWNKQATPYTVYFYASTSTAATSWGTWSGDVFHQGSKQQDGGVWVSTGAWLTFAAGETPVVGVTTPNVKNRTLRKLDHSFEAVRGRKGLNEPFRRRPEACQV
jgi:putative alpha-1,2-mannosidase